MRAIALPLLVILALAGFLSAQSPKTVVVPAATPVAKSQAAAPAAPDNSAALQSAFKMLQEMKATNEETLRKQAVTLELLDQMEQAADQLKIYTKRG